ncbi:MAG: DotH/IcmK family type IV secretion protein [Deltaproteobacteria bacterium]|jgi:hypothetical protein|nr:DotH/IcmK family type IV secretion protein [Deltaproteobacteria bacterium]
MLLKTFQSSNQTSLAKRAPLIFLALAFGWAYLALSGQVLANDGKFIFSPTSVGLEAPVNPPDTRAKLNERSGNERAIPSTEVEPVTELKVALRESNPPLATPNEPLSQTKSTAPNNQPTWPPQASETNEERGPLSPGETTNNNNGLAKKIYTELLKELMPLSPEEIKSARSIQDGRAQALIDAPPGSLINRAMILRLTPGLRPPKVTLTPGLVTALVFTTSTGQPWPITSSVLGNGAVFSAEPLKETEHQIMVSPLAHRGHSNLLVGLKGLDLPLMISLEIFSGQKPHRQVDGVVNFQIKNASRPATKDPPDQITSGLNTAHYLLAGRNPTDGVFLLSDPALPDSQIFQKNNGGPIYLRTPLEAQWPAWSEKVTNPRGSVYEISPVNEIIVKNAGQLFRVNLPQVNLKERD